jgi:hypothetical protein
MQHNGTVFVLAGQINTPGLLLPSVFGQVIRVTTLILLTYK